MDNNLKNLRKFFKLFLFINSAKRGEKKTKILLFLLTTYFVNISFSIYEILIN